MAQTNSFSAWLNKLLDNGMSDEQNAAAANTAFADFNAAAGYGQGTGGDGGWSNPGTGTATGGDNNGYGFSGPRNTGDNWGGQYEADPSALGGMDISGGSPGLPSGAYPTGGTPRGALGGTWNGTPINTGSQAYLRPNIAAPSNFYDESRARQQALIDQLHGIATGQTETAATTLFKQQLQQAQNQNMGTSASLRDVGPGGQAQIAQQNAATIAGQGIEQGNILKLQQRQQAENLLANLYASQRQGDLSRADIDAQNELANRGLNDLLGTSDEGRAINTSIDNANRNFNTSAGMLGIQGGALTAGTKLGWGVQGAATMADYLGRANQGNQNSNRSATASLYDEED